MREMPNWPQLASVAAREGPYAQWSEGFPGVQWHNDSMHIVRGDDMDAGLERLYVAYLADDLDACRISPDYASGLAALLEGKVSLPSETTVLKGQIMGPISWGLGVVTDDRRSLLYDQILGDAVSKHLRLKAAWQERELQRFCGRTCIMLQEPYLSSLGSALMSITHHQIVAMLQEVLAGMQGIKGIHCCGDVDWSMLMETSVDVLSLDAYNYGETLVRHAAQLDAFLARGGMVAWGIVPASSIARDCDAEALSDRVGSLIDHLVERGVDRARIESRGLVTPSCSLGALSVDLAKHILELTAMVSQTLRKRYLEYGTVGDTARHQTSRTHAPQQEESWGF